MSVIERAVEALRRDELAILPTDTVYGLCAEAYRSGPTELLYRVKGRGALQPTALVAPSVEMLLECVPELRGRAGVIARALLPGPYTLILPNPAGRYRWLTGANPEALGVRVPELPEPTASIVAELGAIVATSANLPGGESPRRLEDVPAELRSKVTLAVDGGELPGTPSTVLDFTGPEPRIVREGAAPSAAAFARVREALA